MKIIGLILLVIGMAITGVGLFSEKEIAISDVIKTNKRITFITWGIIISFLGVGINLFSNLDKK